MTTIVFALEATAVAEVIRGCCGRDHEYGPCPFANQESKED